MPSFRRYSLLATLLLFGASGCQSTGKTPSERSGADGAVSTPKAIVIAHRGASAYLPEHTLAAKALAHGQGADFIEQDVVLTRDGVPIVVHDIYLESTTDVAERFPDRAREDGHFYAIDFDLQEVRSLWAHERRDADGSAVFPGRFPTESQLFRVPTLEEEIILIEGLNKARGTATGLYIEMKGSAFHIRHGQDLPKAVVGVLEATGWSDRTEQVFLQSFEPDALRYLNDELKTPLPLIQLIAENSWAEDGEVDYDHLRSEAGLDEIRVYAQGIGPWMMQLYQGRNENGEAILTDLVERAQKRGLAVHPYTFRADALPPGVESFEELHRIFINDLGIDGIFSDFPDRTRQYVDALTNP
ncbi:MAG: glycerophosphodiester phosphodiesterase [Pseudomonadota bacterium]